MLQCREPFWQILIPWTLLGIYVDGYLQHLKTHASPFVLKSCTGAVLIGLLRRFYGATNLQLM